MKTIYKSYVFIYSSTRYNLQKELQYTLIQFPERYTEFPFYSCLAIQYDKYIKKTQKGYLTLYNILFL